MCSSDLKNSSLPVSEESNKDPGTVCDACQQGKSHQLPYPKSSSVSSHPLEIVYSDVWGPACLSSGGFKFYVSFIDDFSKFTWLYCLKHKSEVERVFFQFQAHVERLFNRKIVRVQSDWGGEYEKLNQFFSRIGIHHTVISSTSASRCLHKPPCPFGSGMLRFKQRVSLLIAYPAKP